MQFYFSMGGGVQSMTPLDFQSRRAFVDSSIVAQVVFSASLT
jgi:hypothetical protein